MWNDIAKANEVWAVWHTATVIGTNAKLGKGQIGKHIKKFILLSSQSPSYLKLHASLTETTQKKDLKSDIDLSDKRLTSDGVKVIKHFDGPLLPMVIFYPNDKKGWIRLEPWGPYLESGERPIFIIRKNKQPNAFNALLDSFNKIWGSDDNGKGQSNN